MAAKRRKKHKIKNLPPAISDSYVQIDELWAFVKKRKLLASKEMKG
jgi:hypothetical protein